MTHSTKHCGMMTHSARHYTTTHWLEYSKQSKIGHSRSALADMVLFGELAARMDAENYKCGYLGCRSCGGCGCAPGNTNHRPLSPLSFQAVRSELSGPSG